MGRRNTGVKEKKNEASLGNPARLLTAATVVPPLGSEQSNEIVHFFVPRFLSALLFPLPPVWLPFLEWSQIPVVSNWPILRNVSPISLPNHDFPMNSATSRSGGELSVGVVCECYVPLVGRRRFN